MTRVFVEGPKVCQGRLGEGDFFHKDKLGEVVVLQSLIK